MPFPVIGLHALRIVAVMLLSGGWLLAQSEPLLSKQEAELLKSAEALSPLEAVRLIDAEKPEKASAGMFFALGGFYYKAGMATQARESYLRAVELAPDFAKARLNAVKLMMADGLEREAVPHLSTLLSSRSSGDLSELWLLLAQCRLRLGEHLAAEKAVANAIALKGDDLGAQLLLLQAIAAQPGRIQEAASLARGLLKGNPADSRLWSIWASAELEAGHCAKAMEILETADCFQATDLAMRETLLELAIDQNFAPMACHLALELQGRGELSPKHAQAALDYLQNAKRTLLARELLDALSSGLPPQERLLAQSRQLALEGNVATAIHLLRERLEKEPMDGAALLALSDLLEDKNEAEALLERAILLPECRFQALLKLASHAVEAGDYPRALQFALQARQILDSPELEHFVVQIRNTIQERNKEKRAYP